MLAAGFSTQPLLAKDVDPTAASCGVLKRCGDGQNLLSPFKHLACNIFIRS